MTSIARAAAVVASALGLACVGPEDEPPVSPVEEASGHTLLLRGAAGAEVLIHFDGQAEVQLSGEPGSALCHGRPFCDLPPSDSLSGILFYEFLSETHAVFLEADHERWSRGRLWTVELATGERVRIDDEVSLADSERGRPGWVYAFDRHGERAFFSLLTEDGMRLLASPGPGEQLVSIGHFEPPAPEYPIASWVAADQHGVAWGVETSNGGDGGVLVFRHTNFLLRHDGSMVFGPDDLPWGGEAEDPFNYAGGRFTVACSGEDGQYPETVVVDASTGDSWILDKLAPSFPPPRHALSPNGRWYLEEDREDHHHYRVFDLATGESVGSFDGWLMAWATHDPDLMLFSRGGTELVLYDAGYGAQRSLTGDDPEGIGFLAFNEPEALFAPDGEHLVVLTGAPTLELWENVGIRIIDLDTLDLLDVEEPAVSEDFHRSLRMTPDGRWIVFLDPRGERLDLVAVEVATGERWVLTDTAEDERGVRVGEAFARPR